MIVTVIIILSHLLQWPHYDNSRQPLPVAQPCQKVYPQSSDPCHLQPAPFFHDPARRLLQERQRWKLVSINPNSPDSVAQRCWWILGLLGTEPVAEDKTKKNMSESREKEGGTTVNEHQDILATISPHPPTPPHTPAHSFLSDWIILVHKKGKPIIVIVYAFMCYFPTGAHRPTTSMPDVFSCNQMSNIKKAVAFNKWARTLTVPQTLPDLVPPLKGHSLPPHSCPVTWTAPSKRFGSQYDCRSNLVPKHPQKHEMHPPRVKKSLKKSSISIQTIVVLFVLV